MNKTKTMLSISALFLLVFSLIPLGVVGQESAPAGSTELINPDEMKEEAKRVKLESEVAAAYYHFTKFIVATEAAIDYMATYHGDVDTSAMQDLNDEATDFRDDMTPENFDKEEAKEKLNDLYKQSRDTLGAIVVENDVDKDALKAYVKAAVDASTEVADAKAAWGSTRANAVTAVGAVTGTHFDNYLTIVEATLGDDATDEIRALIEERNAAIDALADAVANFEDMETTAALREEIVDLTKQIKELAQSLKDQLREARKEQIAAANPLEGQPLTGQELPASAMTFRYRGPPIGGRESALGYVGPPIGGRNTGASESESGSSEESGSESDSSEESGSE